MRRRGTEIKDQQAKALLAELNKPFANSVPDADNMDATQLRAAVQEMIDRLPTNGMAQTIDENYLAGVRYSLEQFLAGITSNEDIPFVADTDSLGIAISNLESLKSRGVDLPEYAQRIIDAGQAVNKYKAKNKKSPAKANMPFVDPLAVAEKRIADNENAVDLTSFPNLRNMVSDIKGAKYEFMQPHLQEIQEFFAKDNAPMASLSPEARQALTEYLATIARNGSLAGTTPEETKANANELGRMLFALREEKKSLNPEREGFGNILDTLKQFTAEELYDSETLVVKDANGKTVMEYGRPKQKDVSTFRKFIVKGVDTGFYIKAPEEGGINATYQLIHAETGQVIYWKSESTEARAQAEKASLQLAKALGMPGVPSFESHPTDNKVFFLTSAGDNYNFERITSAYEFIGVDNKRDNAKLAKRMALLDGIAFGVLDGILLNGDRHAVNFLFGINKVENPNGHEELQVLPIDHGFAYAINGERGAVTSVVDHLGSRNARNGGALAKALAESVGAITYKELADLSVQQAIQLIERGEYGKDADPAMIATILERLRQFQGIDVSKVADRLGDK